MRCLCFAWLVEHHCHNSSPRNGLAGCWVGVPAGLWALCRYWVAKPGRSARTGPCIRQAQPRAGLAIQSGQGPLGCKSKLLFGGFGTYTKPNLGFGHLGVSHTQTQPPQPPILLKKGAVKTAALVGGNEESEGGRGGEERERAPRRGGGSRPVDTQAHARTHARTHARFGAGGGALHTPAGHAKQSVLGREGEINDHKEKSSTHRRQLAVGDCQSQHANPHTAHAQSVKNR